MTRPIIRIATEKATPIDESSACSGLRCRLRNTMRAAEGKALARPERSSQPASKLAGGSARIASAGGSSAARRTASSAPAAAASTLTAMAATSSRGLRWKASAGKLK